MVSRITKHAFAVVSVVCDYSASISTNFSRFKHIVSIAFNKPFTKRQMLALNGRVVEVTLPAIGRSNDWLINCLIKR